MSTDTRDPQAGDCCANCLENRGGFCPEANLNQGRTKPRGWCTTYRPSKEYNRELKAHQKEASR